MSKTLKVTILTFLLVGLGWWIVMLLPQQGVVGASNLPLDNQILRDTQESVRQPLHFADNIDDANNLAHSRVELTSTSPYTIDLPIIISPLCRPDPPGESDNINDALIICSGQLVSGQVNDNDWDDVYKILAKANQQLTITMNGTGVGGAGDADLYLYPPGATDVNADPYVDISENEGNNEFIQGTVKVGGYWYIDVFDWADGDGGTNYNLTATLTGPGATGAKTFNLPGSDASRDYQRSNISD